MAALPTTEVFAFSEPKSKAQEISVALNLGPGVLHVLRGARCVWRNLFERLAAEFAATPLPSPLVTSRRRRPRLTGEARFAKYYSVFTRIEGAGADVKRACEEADVNQKVFYRWRKEFRARGYRAPAMAATVAQARKPILKPGGKIL